MVRLTNERRRNCNAYRILRMLLMLYQTNINNKINYCGARFQVCIHLTKSLNFLLKNHWANFNQTWHIASLRKGDSSLFKREPLGQFQPNRKHPL